MPQLEDLRSRAARWWLYDLPPMHGLLRFVFYGGLLWLAQLHPKSPLRGVEQYLQTDPSLYTTHGLVAALGVPKAPSLLSNQKGGHGGPPLQTLN